MGKLTFWWTSSFFSYENRFFIPIVVGVVMLLTVFITVVLKINGLRKKYFLIPWYFFGFLSILLVLISQINSGDYFVKPTYIVEVLTLTGVISFLLSVVMVYILHKIKPFKGKKVDEYKKMNIQDL